ncbi:MAG: YitT family protein [Syntrophomonadaceae bacterium]|jgi:uncharacterized membrane-anchored protein YitT (DUF2179 family)|nr:YitT family protein [Syntrophomonadaceae bacterium]
MKKGRGFYMTKIFRSFLLLTLGSFLDAAGFYFFMAPNDIAAGGINGLSLIFNTYLPQFPLGSLVLIMSVFFLSLGFILIGAVFGFKTIYCSILIPLIIWGLEYLYPLTAPMGNDTLVQLVFGVLISGTGVALLLNQNASSGGTDIGSRILHKYYHLDLGKGLFIIDFFITIAAAITFGFEKGMYALLGVLLYSLVIDAVIAGFNVSKHVIIITRESKLLKQFIIQDLQRGATIYTAQGAYTGEDREVIMTILGRRQFIQLRDYIKNLDPQAFISVQNTHEVLGEGFRALE